MGKAKISSNTDRTCILILGMHRSGTSALAGVLSKIGCELPAHEMAPSASNAKGFFESTVIRDLNEELLASAGSSWDDFTEFYDGWLSSPKAEKFLDRTVVALEGEFASAELFVLKDPRICRLVPFWARALERFGCVVKPILTIRNPLDVGHSLLTKKGLSEPVSQMVWLRHVLDAEHATRGMPRMHTSFEQLMQGWELLVGRAQQDLQVVWPKSIASVELEVSKFLSGELRHHREAPSRTLDSALLPEWLRVTYGVLTRWADTGEKIEDHRILDRIKGEFDAASKAFARAVRAEREVSNEQRHKIEELKEIAKRLQSECDEANATTKRQRLAAEATLQESRAAWDAEYRALARSLEKERTRLETKRLLVKNALEKEHSARVEAEDRIATLSAACQQQDELLKMQVLRTAELETELIAMRGNAEEELASLEGKLQDQRRRNTLMSAELHKLKEASETLEFQLAETRSELAASHARRKEAARIIARRDAEIQARFQELAVLERKIIQWNLSARFLRFLRRVRASVRKTAYS